MSQADDRVFIKWKHPLHLLIDNERTHSLCGEWHVVRMGNTLVMTQWRYIQGINDWEAFFSLTIPRD